MTEHNYHPSTHPIQPIRRNGCCCELQAVFPDQYYFFIPLRSGVQVAQKKKKAHDSLHTQRGQRVVFMYDVTRTVLLRA